MTTLELAEKVAWSAIMATRPDGSKPYGDAAAEAVLRCLREYDSWFCRLTLTEDAQGLHRDTLEEPYELVQMDLYK